MPKDGPIKSHIQALLGEHQIRMTPSDLEGALHRQMPGVKRSALRKAIREMVTDGVLVYTNHFSTTHLEMNFNRPVRVSDRVTLCPANCLPPKEGNSITIKLNDGTAFGVGDHPTTRLCIQGLDDALIRYRPKKQLGAMTALDIGTGSAVLAMVAVGLGIGAAVGIDIDPLACNEAKANLALNGMTDRITITDQPLGENDKTSYAVIMANLRPPTLKQLFPVMEKISVPEAIWVLSGFRSEEELGDGRMFLSNRARTIWRSQERGWAGLVLKLSQPPPA